MNEAVSERDSLPKGWIKIKIGTILEPTKKKFEPQNSNNRIFIGLEHVESNTGKILVKGNSMNTKSTKTVFHSGDILYGKLRPYLNKVCIPNFDGVCSTDILVFPQNENFSNKYVSYFLSSPKIVRFATRNSTGMHHPRIKFELISKCNIPLPPLNEQKRIVSKIQSIFAQIDTKQQELEKVASQIRSVPDSFAELKGSILKRAFEGRLVPQDPHDEPAEILLRKIHKDSAKDLNFEKKDHLPKGWTYASIGNLVRLINGKAFKPTDWSDSGLPIVRIQNLNNSEKPFNYCNFEVDEKFLINNGQLLFSWSGTPHTSFGAFIWNRGKAILNQHIFRVELNESFLDKRYLQYVLNHNLDEYIAKAHGGVGLRHITKGKLEESLLQIAPLNEQKRIVSKIESIFVQIDTKQQELEKLASHIRSVPDSFAELKGSILKKAFEGRLVPQDSHDEPASVLLERIK